MAMAGNQHTKQSSGANRNPVRIERIMPKNFRLAAPSPGALRSQVLESCRENRKLPAEGVLTTNRGRGMQITNGNRQRVRGIGRLRDLLQPEQPRHHQLHLLLLCLTVTCDGGLNGKGSIFGHRELVGRSRQHGYSADLTQLQRRFYVYRIENVFNGHAVGAMLLEQSAKLVEDGR